MQRTCQSRQFLELLRSFPSLGDAVSGFGSRSYPLVACRRRCCYNSCGSRLFRSNCSLSLRTDKAIHFAQKLRHKTRRTKNKRCQIVQCLILQPQKSRQTMLPGQKPPSRGLAQQRGRNKEEVCRARERTGHEKAAKWCRLPGRRNARLLLLLGAPLNLGTESYLSTSVTSVRATKLRSDSNTIDFRLVLGRFLKIRNRES